jgi:RNA polymerase sigma-70 factor (ECF subfamily)
MGKGKNNILLNKAFEDKSNQALAVLHSEYYTQIKYYIAAQINSEEDAEDLAQNVFVELCRTNCQYDNNQNTKAYLLGITRNLVARYRREKRSQPKIFNIGSIDDISQNLNVHPHREYEELIIHTPQQLKKMLREAIAELPNKTSEAIKLRFIEGIAPKNAAQKAGCSVYAFYQRLYYGIEKIKRFLAIK